MLILWVLGCMLLNFHYTIQFILAYFFWKKVPTNFEATSNPQLRFSIVVAMRNEEDNVQALIDTVAALDYPKELYEVLLMDDFSEDRTIDVAEGHIKQVSETFQSRNETAPQIRVIPIAHQGLKHYRAFKKTAIQIGVSKAQNDWIVTTDADCEYAPQYLKTLHGFIDFHKPKFISGPVELGPKKTLFQRMQALEFRGLVALGAAYIQRERPFLCNGANMAFKKSVFQQLNGYKGYEHMESGDDIWFMHKVQERYPFEIYFARHQDLIVRSHPSKDFREFINQRKRWTAKNSSYKKWSQIFTLAFDYLFYVAIGANLVLSIFFSWAWALLVLMVLSKALVELNFYLSINKFYKDRSWPWVFVLTFPLQVFYIIMIYPLSQLTKFQWKNRTFNA